jgi:hypothetical protein
MRYALVSLADKSMDSHAAMRVQHLGSSPERAVLHPVHRPSARSLTETESAIS